MAARQTGAHLVGSVPPARRRNGFPHCQRSLGAAVCAALPTAKRAGADAGSGSNGRCWRSIPIWRWTRMNRPMPCTSGTANCFGKRRTSASSPALTRPRWISPPVMPKPRWSPSICTLASRPRASSQRIPGSRCPCLRPWLPPICTSAPAPATTTFAPTNGHWSRHCSRYWTPRLTSGCPSSGTFVRKC